MKNTKEIGNLGEDIACKYLKKNKYKILERNYFASHNELDIIAENKEYIVFIEVKTRSCPKNGDFAFGTPASAVTYTKQQRTVSAAREYLSKSKSGKQPRLDVIEIYLDKNTNEPIQINHIENAFGV